MSVKSAPHTPESRRANKAEVAEFFGVSIPAVDGWIRRGCPAVQRGQRGVPWVFDLLAVAEWRFTPAKVEEPADADIPPSDPQEAWYYWRAKRERRNFELEEQEVMHRDEHRREMSKMAKEMAATWDMFPDMLERDCGLEPEAIEAVERLIDDQRYQLYQRVIGDNDGDG